MRTVSSLSTLSTQSLEDAESKSLHRESNTPLLSFRHGTSEDTESSSEPWVTLFKLFELMQSVVPRSTHVQQLVLNGCTEPFTCEGELLRLKLLAHTLSIAEREVPNCTCTLRTGLLDEENSSCFSLMIFAFLYCKGPDTVTSLLERRNPRIERWTTLILWSISTCYFLVTQCKLATFAAETNPRAKKTICEPVSSSYWRLLRKEGLDVLFAIMTDQCGGGIPDTVDLAETEVWNRPIVIPEVLSLIFETLATAPTELRDHSLQKCHLLCRDPSNVEVIVRQPRWRTWFEPLLANKTLSTYENSMMLLCSMHFQRFKYERNARCFGLETMDYHHELGWGVERAATVREIFSRTLRAIIKKRVEFSNNYDFAVERNAWCWNILQFLNTIYSFIFFRVTETGGEGNALDSNVIEGNAQFQQTGARTNVMTMILSFLRHELSMHLEDSTLGVKFMDLELAQTAMSMLIALKLDKHLEPGVTVQANLTERELKNQSAVEAATLMSLISAMETVSSPEFFSLSDETIEETLNRLATIRFGKTRRLFKRRADIHLPKASGVLPKNSMASFANRISVFNRKKGTAPGDDNNNKPHVDIPRPAMSVD